MSLSHQNISTVIIDMFDVKWISTW